MQGSGGGASLNQFASSPLGNGHQLNSIYVDVARVINRQTLPPSGLTVTTQLPLYVEGHFNAPNTTAGSTNTANTKPVSLVGDAIQRRRRKLPALPGKLERLNKQWSFYLQWAFDVNFLDYRRLPPATPMVRKLIRGQWNVVAAQ